MIDLDKGKEIWEQRLSLHDLAGHTEFSKEFGTENCHYLTQALTEKLKSNKVIEFYLSASNQVVHSAVLLNDKVVDCYGISSVEDTEQYYNFYNWMMRTYQVVGECRHRILNFDEFDPNSHYSTVPEDTSRFRLVADKWFDSYGRLKPLT